MSTGRMRDHEFDPEGLRTLRAEGAILEIAREVPVLMREAGVVVPMGAQRLPGSPPAPSRGLLLTWCRVTIGHSLVSLF